MFFVCFEDHLVKIQKDNINNSIINIICLLLYCSLQTLLGCTLNYQDLLQTVVIILKHLIKQVILVCTDIFI